MNDPQARQVAELQGLAGDRERAGDDRLRGDHGRDAREEDHRHAQPVGNEHIDRVGRDGRVLEDVRALAEVVERERRKGDDQLGAPDRPAAEVSHVRVQRLGAR